ncbi:MAG: TonB family protein, partial [Elusimicrobia bacterium]|nr:TonB family protein [Elusimicrobiota bacterium]
MTGGRMPVSLASSLAVHAAAIGLWLLMARQAARQRPMVVGNVDLIIPLRAPSALPQAPAAQPAVSTLAFLKMALPAVPRLVLPKAVEALPRPRLLEPSQAPRLRDRALPLPRMALDLNSRARAPKLIGAAEPLPSRHVQALAAPPKLEEVGRRRAPEFSAPLALEPRRENAQALKGGLDQELEARRRAPAQERPLREAAPPPASALRRALSAVLAERRLSLGPAAAPEAVLRQGVESPAIRPRRADASLRLGAGKKKGVELEGPVADRKVAVYDIPKFPQWAKDEGVLDVSVAIRFWVDELGEVLPDMRVERSSGYGRLDLLAMRSLKRWRFVPAAARRQWGVIT